MSLVKKGDGQLVELPMLACKLNIRETRSPTVLLKFATGNSCADYITFLGLMVISFLMPPTSILKFPGGTAVVS
ncbi:hypothetical protein AOB57_012640 [Methanosarcina flavescens]|uniref:Uncharacterized protein n=1 Tax=Methanosarcina flavescens TaxID=1715806 RepID=A0A660HUG8_9EURY|nr:hypothetical protein AOB57_012640 [Methanosarcina flavescens]